MTRLQRSVDDGEIFSRVDGSAVFNVRLSDWLRL